MGLFNFYNKAKQNGETMELPSIHSNTENINIPESVFIENSEPTENELKSRLNGNVGDLESIYNFLQADYEEKGYNDALISPDESYKTDNIMLFKQDLNILIQKVSTKYEDQIREIDFHISSRERAGLIDLVEELRCKKSTL